MVETRLERSLRLAHENGYYGSFAIFENRYPVVMMERGAGRNKFLKELKCQHYDGEKCTRFGKCIFPDCRYYVVVEEC